MNEHTLHIIHDNTRIDRQELYERELAEQEIYNYHLWPAVKDERGGFFGISQAHKKIVRFAKQNKWPKVIIAEDDIRFTARGAWQYFLRNEPKDYDLYLCGIYTGDLKEDNTVEDFSGLTLYMVNERFYDDFLRVTIANHLDRQLARMGKYVVCNPFAAFQWTTYSENKQCVISHTHLLRGRRLWNPTYENK